MPTIDLVVRAKPRMVSDRLIIDAEPVPAYMWLGKRGAGDRRYKRGTRMLGIGFHDDLIAMFEFEGLQAGNAFFSPRMSSQK